MSTNYASGHYAERQAAEYLKKHGYKIIAMNWRHTRAEIDIIAQKKSRFGLAKHPLVFFEVKHRKNSEQGYGLDYITPKKLAQMQFAANLYISQTNYSGELRLGAVELIGEDYMVANLLEDIT